jgi:predicted permease
MLRDLFSDLHFRFRALFRRGDVERELAQELALHIEVETDRLVREGIPADEARRQARLALGGVEQVKEATRDARGLAWLDIVAQDLRWASRSLRRNPNFTIGVILTIALGLGANAALFGVIDRLMFRPPAYLRSPAQVNRVYSYSFIAGANRAHLQMNRKTFADIERGTNAFEQVAGFSDQSLPVGAGSASRQAPVGAVTGSYFDLFAARPTVGRFIAVGDDRAPDGAPVVVLSYAYWRDQFGARTDAVGATLKVGDIVRTVIGVAPEGFVGITDGPPPALWIPADERTWRAMVVRRRPGVSEAAASAALSFAFARSWADDLTLHPRIHAPLDVARPTAAAVSLLAMRRPDAGPEARILPWIAGVGLIVLLITCANVANLLLTRALRRRREIAIRLALGISRARLLAQLTTEGLLLATLGGGAGLILAHWGAEALRVLLLPQDDALVVLRDTRTLVFAACAVLVVGVVSGLAPMALGLREELVTRLKSGTREGTYQKSRARSALLVVQVALSAVLLVGAGLFVQSLAKLRAHGLGYDVEPILTANVDLRGTHLDASAVAALTRTLEGKVTTIPGVVRAARTTAFSGMEFQPISVAGGLVAHWESFRLVAAGPAYFATLGTHILRGRAFDERDGTDAPRVAVVSEATARALWPNENAMGRCLRVGLGTKGITEHYIDPDTEPCRTVVGITEDVKRESFTSDPGLQYYLPAEQWHNQPGGLVIRVAGDAGRDAEAIQRRLQGLMPGNSAVTVTPLSVVLAPQMRPWQLGADLFVAFAALALAVASVGVFAVISYDVEQRTHELAVRIAFGAESEDVVGLVAVRAMGVGGIGLAAGIAMALGVGRWVGPLLFAESPRDPAVYGTVALVLLATATIASVVPALRAVRTDPNVVLRNE